MITLDVISTLDIVRCLSKFGRFARHGARTSVVFAGFICAAFSVAQGLGGYGVSGGVGGMQGINPQVVFGGGLGGGTGVIGYGMGLGGNTALSERGDQEVGVAAAAPAAPAGTQIKPQTQPLAPNEF